MLKILRKYNKWILVIGGSLLMVAFLAPGAIQSCTFNPANKTVARLDGRKIKAKEFDVARRQYGAMSEYFPQTVDPSIFSGEDKVTHWLLLGYEARQGGFVGEKADGMEWVTGELAQSIARPIVEQEFLTQQFGEMASQVNPQVLYQYLLNTSESQAQFFGRLQQVTDDVAATFVARHDQFAGAASLSPDEFDEALSTTRGIWRMLDSHFRAARLSDKRTLQYSASLRDQAYVDAAYVPAEAVIDQVPEPTEEEIIAQFEAYKDSRPGEGEYGVGYTFPPRVKLTYMTIDRNGVAGAIELDAVEVNKHWRQNRGQFPGEFATERARVERILTERLVETVKSLAHESVQREVAKVTSRLPEEEGFRTLPDDWEQIRPRLEDIAPLIVEHVREGTKGEIIREPELGVTIPLPVVTVLGAEFRTAQELQRLPGIGRSQATVGPREFSFAGVALGIHELGGSSPDLTVQVNVPMAEVKLDDAAGNRYYMTVTDYRDESPPDSFEVIRDDLVQDFKEIAAFKILEGRIDELRTAAVEGTLLAVSDIFKPAEPLNPLDSPEPNPVVMRNQVQVGELGVTPNTPDMNQPALREGVLEIADMLDPMAPVSDAPIAGRTIAVAVPKQRGVVVVQVVGLNPLTSEVYRSAEERDMQQAKTQEFAEAMADTEELPYSFTSLVARHNYKVVGGKGDKDDEVDAEPDEAAD